MTSPHESPDGTSPADRAVAPPPSADGSMIDTAILVLRLWTGTMLVVHGNGKVFGGLEKFTLGIAKFDFPFPELAAPVAAWSEFGGGILLILGFGTRPVAVLAGITMAVAAFVRHADDPFSKQELALTYLVSLVVLLVAGAGKYSIDRQIYNAWNRRKTVL